MRRAAALQEPENMSDQPPVSLAVDADGITALTLNRPEQLNAFDPSFTGARPRRRVRTWAW